MNTQEACDLLGVKIGCSNEDISKAFKSKVVEFHPDRNGGSKEAEEKFKIINEAYQFLNKFSTQKPAYNDTKSPFYDASVDFSEELKKRMDDMFNPFGPFGKVNIKDQFNSNYTYGYDRSSLNINLTISFEEAVLGCNKEISYSRVVKSDSQHKIPCQKCNGTGRRKYGSGVVRPADNRELPCNACVGKGSIDDGRTVKEVKEKFNVKLQAGVVSNTRLNLGGKGNYFNNVYEDLVINISVLPSTKGLTLVGGDVISTIDLTLLEALKGTKKSICTVLGDKLLEFKPKIKNGDRVRVSGFGVPPNGAHVIIVNVSYPDDVFELIKALEPEKVENPAHSEF